MPLPWSYTAHFPATEIKGESNGLIKRDGVDSACINRMGRIV